MRTRSGYDSRSTNLVNAVDVQTPSTTRPLFYLLGLSPLLPRLSNVEGEGLQLGSRATQHWRGGSGVYCPCATNLISFYRQRPVVQYMCEQVFPTLGLASRFVLEALLRARSLVPSAPVLRSTLSRIARAMFHGSETELW